MADSAPTAPTSSANASATYTTPTKRPAFTSVNADAGPSRARPSGASPAYSSRKHSLYGVEDRVIIDPGSRVWKVGYSGEYDPRAVLWASDWMDTHEESGKGVWELDLADTARANGDMAEAGRLVAGRILQLARDTYIRHLKTDSKTRKVIILENTFLPDFVKQSLAKAFFENLQVPSVAFTSTPVLALAACGRATGLVVDVGWLETIITPVYHSRPMYHMARSTPLAGQALHRRLRALLLDCATYIPPSSSWSATPPHAGSVPVAILTDRLIERIITEACFAGVPISEPYVPVAMSGDQDGVSAAARNKVECEALQARYEAHCDATDVQFELRTPEGVGRLSVPGWMRERAVEVLFGDDGSEAVPLQDVILQVVSKLAVDLRAPMLSSILVTGGTASLPGFTPRLRDTLLQSLSASAQPPTSLDAGTQPSPPKVHRITSPEYRAAETAAWRRRHERPYAVLAPLRGKLAILNDPCPLDVLESENEREGALGAGSGSTSKGQGRSAGRAPRWTPGLMPWVGASLAGALKTGGPAITREEHDTRSALNAEKSVAYNKALEAEWQREIEAATTAESLATEPQGASAVAKPPSGRVFEGVQLEDLLPGMALMGGQSRRKRGWRSEVGVQDWARVLRT